jgi:orotidine-5'-phosphate decarboxylase
MKNFGQRLADAVRSKGNCVCVGLDPRLDQLPDVIKSGKSTAAAYEDFCKQIIDIVAPLVPVVKPQAAFFEALGATGCSALANVNAYAQQNGLLVVMDAKRGDIGSTAEAYAEAYLTGVDSPWHCDSLTVNPFLGDDTLQPFTSACRQHGTGLFVLVKTSNPGSAFIQQAIANDMDVSSKIANWISKTNAEFISVGKLSKLALNLQSDLGEDADTESDLGEDADSLNYGPIGAVVGATYPAELERLRATLANAWLLIPGYGAQGGTAQELKAAWNKDGLGAIVNSSRGIIFAYRSKSGIAHDWKSAIKNATLAMIDDLAACR